MTGCSVLGTQIYSNALCRYSLDQWCLVVLFFLVIRSSYNAVLKAQSIALEIIGGTMSDWFLGIRNLGLLGMIWQIQSMSVKISGS